MSVIVLSVMQRTVKKIFFLALSLICKIYFVLIFITLNRSGKNRPKGIMGLSTRK